MEILPFAAMWMDLENIMLSEMSNIEKQILYDITYVWNLKNKTNELICKTETDSLLWLPKWKAVWKGEIN